MTISQFTVRDLNCKRICLTPRVLVGAPSVSTLDHREHSPSHETDIPAPTPLPTAVLLLALGLPAPRGSALFPREGRVATPRHRQTAVPRPALRTGVGPPSLFEFRYFRLIEVRNETM